ncbi:MAG TPA: NDP-sugar synthase [Acidimicrobiales bacterium]|nr:NDP-sugar synthase [Acidimicrobiales bacterium]
MRAVVLVGGQGTRLRPLTLTAPKQMLPVAEVAMIERVLGHLAAHGIDSATLSMGYRPDAFLAAFPDDRCAGVSLDYAVEPEPLDTAGAIRFAARHAAVGDTFLVVNGDVLSDVDLSALVRFHREAGGRGTIALTPMEDPSTFGVVPTDGHGRVTAFIEKPPRHLAPTNLVNAGFYVLEPDVVDRIPGGRRVNIERETFPALAAEGSLFALASDSYWTDTGTPGLYLAANLHLAGRDGRPPAPGARRTDQGGWVLGGPVLDADVGPGSLVGDAAYLGKGAVVSRSVVGAGCRVDGATVEGSVLLPGAVVRHGAAVAGSIVGPGAVIGEEAEVVGLSVVGEGVEVDAGARLVGARLPATPG